MNNTIHQVLFSQKQRYRSSHDGNDDFTDLKIANKIKTERKHQRRKKQNFHSGIRSITCRTRQSPFFKPISSPTFTPRKSPRQRASLFVSPGKIIHELRVKLSKLFPSANIPSEILGERWKLLALKITKRQNCIERVLE